MDTISATPNNIIRLAPLLEAGSEALLPRRIQSRRLPRLILGLFALLAAWNLNARVESGQIQREINATVWTQFKTAFETLDGEALNALYAERVLRVTPEGIDTQGAFRQHNATRFDGNRKNGDRIRLDFWFDDRKTNTTTSYEVGFYRIRVTSPAGAVSQFHGQFHIVLEKQNGQWKIVQDWDTSAIGGQPITAADFARRNPINLQDGEAED